MAPKPPNARRPPAEPGCSSFWMGARIWPQTPNARRLPAEPGCSSTTDLQPRLVYRQPQPVPADHLVVGQAALQVLGDHVDVLEVALHQVALVHGGGAGRAV